MARLIRPYDLILDARSGWRAAAAEAPELRASLAEGAIELRPLERLLPEPHDPGGTFGGHTLSLGVATRGDHVYIADPALTQKDSYPDCSVPQLQLNVYRSDWVKVQPGPGVAPGSSRQPVAYAPGAGLTLALENGGLVTLQVFDCRGQSRYSATHFFSRGAHAVPEAPTLTRGVYHYRLSASGWISAGRLLLL